MKLSELDGFAWRKSSYSAGDDNCVEVAWRKSSYSGPTDCVEVAWRKITFSGGDGNCVEVAAVEASVLLRDSKNPGGPTLAVSTGPWRELMRRVG